MTRRLVPWALTEQWMGFVSDAPSVGGVYVHESEKEFYEREAPRYKVGDVVAVAQSYRDVCASCFEPNAAILRLFEDQRLASWSNKMFVKAELMPHQIRITGIKCERLYDISEADCLREGIRYLPQIGNFYFEDMRREEGFYFDDHREAFASLIDKVSGRGTWGQNPWVVAYEFELRKGQKSMLEKCGVVGRENTAVT